MLEKVAASDIESFPEEARTLLGDKDTLMSAVSTAHDTRVAKLDAKEDLMRTDEEVSCGGMQKAESIVVCTAACRTI